ncbi:hypothetical protein DCAR_0414455 [Daucus carota subsp. sativus]|uniref:Uncharacterized protein n=1 Tax=Daucus carota subsp. sativus TaxID=79200 RepID=A0AAF0WS75_DAUCS|nr:hypothetical protein DCAR_0414455 [Daucus carota subsp. sativus]
MSSARIGPQASLWSKKRGSAPLPIHGISKITLKVVVFHFRRFRLPLILHLSTQQGLLSPLILPSPFPWLWFRWIVDRDSGNLINPFMRHPQGPSQCFVLIKQSDSPCPYQNHSQSVPQPARGNPLSPREQLKQSTGSRRVRDWDPCAQPSEPILFPKLRIHFADFPCLHWPPGAHRTPRDVRCSTSRWTLPPAKPFPGWASC